MERLKKLCLQQPLIPIVFILACISCFAIFNATPLISKVSSPETLWLKQGLFYLISAIIIFIILQKQVMESMTAGAVKG